jgi:hypothetical protein
MLNWEGLANPSVFRLTARAALRRDLLEMIKRDINRPSCDPVATLLLNHLVGILDED